MVDWIRPRYSDVIVEGTHYSEESEVSDTESTEDNGETLCGDLNSVTETASDVLNELEETKVVPRLV